MAASRFTEFLARLRQSSSTQDRERLTAILTVNRALASARDEAGVLRLFLDEAIRLFGAERGFVVMREEGQPDGLPFTVRAARSLDQETVQRPERKLSMTVLHRALGLGDGAAEPVFSEDALSEDLGGNQSIADLNLRSVLCTPLGVGGDQPPLGAIYLDHRFQKGAFAPDDLPWFQAFADQAGITLHLHGLLADNREFARRVLDKNLALQVTVAEQAQELGRQPGLSRSELKHPFRLLLGESTALLTALRLLDRVVDTDLPVLIEGESGTGKELVARSLHEESFRRTGRLVAVNVAAVTQGLLESELFGHVKGAFTDASSDRRGLLAEADGGTLFLDEVTEMPLDVQVKLLRFLEDRTVRPVGGEQERRVDIRLVAATNRDPEAAVQDGSLREDLYYRLAVVRVRMPALRERVDDIPALASRFFAMARGDRLGVEARGGSAPGLPDELMAALSRRPWPGNVRELRNEVRRLDALAGDGVPGVADLSPRSAAAEERTATRSFNLAESEQETIRAALVAAGGNKAEAARLLGISRRTLYNKLDS